MTFLQGLALGALQGVCEWLPVSSEGITSLVLVNAFDLPVSRAVFLSLWLHLGTLVAAVVYFRQELANLVVNLPPYFRELYAHRLPGQSPLITFLIVATLISVAIGSPLLLAGISTLEIPGSSAAAVIGVLLIVNGLVQRWALGRATGSRAIPHPADGLLVGAAQGLAVMPGLSRSGLTVSVLLFRGYRSEEALRLSFLLSIPVVLAAALGLMVLGRADFGAAALGGVLGAAVVGFATISALMKVALKLPFWIFCIALGLASLVPWLAGL